MIIDGVGPGVKMELTKSVRNAAIRKTSKTRPDTDVCDFVSGLPKTDIWFYRTEGLIGRGECCYFKRVVGDQL